MTHTVTESAPLNMARPTDPLVAVVRENRRLTPAGRPDVHHLVLDLGDSGFKYWGGQSVGVLPPGTDEAGKAYRPRLYSISSGRQGDDGAGQTVSLTIKRVVYTDETGSEKRGVASNFMCDLAPGDAVKLIGPVGKHFVLPADVDTPMVFFATGTGIAPFRSFWQERGAAGKAGRFLLFGYRTAADALYAEEIAEAFDPANVRIALGEEETTPAGTPMFVGDRLPELEERLWPHVASGKLMVYLCGLKGMEVGIDAAFAAMAGRRGADWAALKAEMVASKRWLAETY